MEISLGHIANCKKLAVMGGTFDPIHYGHLVTAEAVRSAFGAERVLFIPAGRPPHKTGVTVTDQEHRYLMTVLATIGNPYFYTSRIEIDRQGETYTIDTIAALHKICGKDTTLYFITGADAISDIHTWKGVDALMTMCHFVAVTRPGYNKDKLMRDICDINTRYKGRLHFLDVPALAISSTDIRARVASQAAIKYLLPEQVETYIFKHGLYKKADEPVDSERVEAYVRERLSEKRMLHTMGVVRAAEKLAVHYGYDVQKARLAALLHDCAKEIPAERKKELCRDYNIQLDDIMKKQLDLVHGFLGAEAAKREFAISDEDVLNAIRYHTTGRKKMSLLEKIICIADIIEDGRVSDKRAAAIARTAYENIDEAMVLGLQYKFTNCAAREQDIHPLGETAFKYYRKRTGK